MEQSFPIQQILERYDVRDMRLAFRLSEMRALNIDPEFIFTLLKMFEEEDSFPEQELNNYPLSVILDYLRRTHKYYISKKLPEIEQSIELLLMDFEDNHPLLLLLRNFYLQYKADLTSHIQREEKYLLPHIRLLLETETKNYEVNNYVLQAKNFSVQKFVETHTDTEGDLQKVRESIGQYAPLATNLTPYRILLTQLELFEKDLSVHAIIEDMVLIPRALKIEEAIAVKMDSSKTMN